MWYKYRMEKNVVIIKRDGSTENFDKNKIAKVVKAAGLNDSQAAILSENIYAWGEQSGKEKITSLEIRDKVLEQLKIIDGNAAGLYEWYEKTKEGK